MTHTGFHFACKINATYWISLLDKNWAGVVHIDTKHDKHKTGF